MHPEALECSDNRDGDWKRGGCADIAKATAPSLKILGPDGRNVGSTQAIAIKMFRFGDDVDRRTQIAVRPLRLVLNRCSLLTAPSSVFYKRALLVKRAQTQEYRRVYGIC